MAIRKRNLFQPGADVPFSLSRSKLDNFLNCPRCFYIDRRLGVSPPNGPPFNINIAVDLLLKREFDDCRSRGVAHPYMVRTGKNLVPFADPRLDAWRENFKGVRTVHEESGFELFGAVDDLWLDKDSGEVVVVDYKATSKESEINLNADWQIAYKRQMDIYQWLLRRNGLTVSSVGYFVYLNGRRDVEFFNGRVEFEVFVLEYVGNDSWVSNALVEASNCLRARTIPMPSPVCDQCKYLASLSKVLSISHQ
jgi:CRISPR/Cas system-associated exonuclease Cas4 (RecB family)